MIIMLQDQPRDGPGYWPILAWKPSATSSQHILSLFTDEEWAWVNCIIQWTESLLAVVAWRLHATHMFPYYARGLTEIIGSSGIVADGVKALVRPHRAVFKPEQC